LHLIRTFKPTHIHAFNHFLVFSFRPALMLTRTPLVYRAGDVPVRHRLIWRALWRFIVRRTTKFLAVSEFIAAKLTSAGVAADRIDVIYGIPPTRVTPRDASHSSAGIPAADPGVADIVFVGQIIGDKGPDLLIDAFRAVSQRFPVARLLIVGRVTDWEGDAWAKQLRDRVARDPAIASRVIFTGFVEDVPALLRGRTVLVAPSLIEEALGLVVLEAKQAGVPAIVFPSGGLPEMIEQGRTGWICDAKTAPALADCLARYLSNPALAAQHGAAARESLRRFGVDAFGSRLMANFTS
jgi:glycosyltransferase involved in cell wall biosynthesis